MTIVCGIVFALIAVGFLAVPAMPGTSMTAAYLLAASSGVLAIAFLVPRSRPVTVRLIAAAVFAGAVAFLISAIRGRQSGSPNSPDLFNAIVVFVCFGLPAASVALLGGRQQWGLASRASGSESDTDARKRFKPVALSWRRIPKDAKFLIDGFAMERTEAETIMGEIYLRSKAISAPRSHRLIGTIGMVLILIGGLGFGVWRKTSPTITSFAVVFSAIAWNVAWMWMWRWMRPQRLPPNPRWQVLAEHGYPICIECGYNLLGTGASGPCPECGWRRDDGASV